MELGKISTFGLCIGLIAVMVVLACASVFIGAVSIPFDYVVRILINKITFGYVGDLSGIPDYMVSIVWRLYAPRVLLGLIVGAGLAMVGVVMQAMVQNPLADPYILGISSGASIGATFAILMGASVLAGTMFSSFGIQFFAFVGALGSSAFVFILSAVGGRITTTKLVLSGVIISCICSAISNLIVYLEPDAEGMRSLTFWLMGSLSTQDFGAAIQCGIFVLIGLVFFSTQMRNLNAMMLGDSTATTLGVDLNRLRKIYIVLTSVIIAIIVCNCGVIGFVGLIIPHIARGLVGTNHWKLFPVSILIGAIFMMLADIAARSMASSEIPIGIITSLCGAPVFAYIMLKKSYGFGGGEGSRWTSTCPACPSPCRRSASSRGPISMWTRASSSDFSGPTARVSPLS
ncbi:MAG: iron ABC transporter permease [Thermoplasmata archaeon]|nr:iron ABC transporter permease [Thermoplasmata archaeon]